MKYRTTRNGQGHLVVHDVPIFVECERGDAEFTAKWVADAVLAAQQAEAEGYMPPLHIRHHGEDAPAEPAGFFRVTRAADITFQGSRKTAVYADLVVTRAWVEDDILAMRLPYRSVEIFDINVPAISSLALLDHEPPFLQLPMLQAEAPPGNPSRAPTGVMQLANATIDNPWRAEGYQKAEPVVACFRHGRGAHFFTQDTDDMITDTETKTEDAVDAAKYTDEENGDAMPATSDSVAALCETIKSGEISVADLESLKQAIVEALNGGENAAEEEEQQPDEPAPAPTPGEAMAGRKTGTAAKFAALAAKVDAQDVEIAQMKNDAARKAAVDEALLRLDGRPLGADPAEKFGERFDELGAAGFRLYVNDLAGMFGKMPSGAAGKAAAFAGQAAAAPESALSYTDQGADAVERAAKFAAEHRELAARSMTRKSEEAYVRSNMARAGFKPSK
jgi:hypothetical protein